MPMRQCASRPSTEPAAAAVECTHATRVRRGASVPRSQRLCASRPSAEPAAAVLKCTHATRVRRGASVPRSQRLCASRPSAEPAAAVLKCTHATRVRRGASVPRSQRLCASRPSGEPAAAAVVRDLCPQRCATLVQAGRWTSRRAFVGHGADAHRDRMLDQLAPPSCATRGGATLVGHL